MPDLRSPKRAILIWPTLSLRERGNWLGSLNSSLRAEEFGRLEVVLILHETEKWVGSTNELNLLLVWLYQPRSIFARSSAFGAMVQSHLSWIIRKRGSKTAVVMVEGLRERLQPSVWLGLVEIFQEQAKEIYGVVPVISGWSEGGENTATLEAFITQSAWKEFDSFLARGTVTTSQREYWFLRKARVIADLYRHQFPWTRGSKPESQ